MMDSLPETLISQGRADPLHLPVLLSWASQRDPCHCRSQMVTELSFPAGFTGKVSMVCRGLCADLHWLFPIPGLISGLGILRVCAWASQLRHHSGMVQVTNGASICLCCCLPCTLSLIFLMSSYSFL